MKKFFVFLTCVLTPIILSAQTKVYKGQMIMPKETPKIFVSGTTSYSPGETKCDAEYSYYERGGQRIKHGKFVYRYTGYSG